LPTTIPGTMRAGFAARPFTEEPVVYSGRVFAAMDSI
jgi:hypothetical protein